MRRNPLIFVKYYFGLAKRSRHPIILIITLSSAFIFSVQEVFDLPLSRLFGAIPARLDYAYSQLWIEGITLGNSFIFLTLFIPMFLHGSPEHLVSNLVFLWIFGSLCDRVLGKWWTLSAFFFCGAFGFIVQTLLNPASLVPIIGASGAICGLEGVYFGLLLRWPLPSANVWPLSGPISPVRLGIIAIAGISCLAVRPECRRLRSGPDRPGPTRRPAELPALRWSR